MKVFKRGASAMVLAVFLAFAAPYAGAVPALVQSTYNQHYSVTSFTATLNSVAAGDLLVLEVSYNDAEAPISVVDSNGTPQAAIAFESSTSEALGIYYVPNAAAGTHTFTVTVSTAASYYLFAEEFSGVAATSPLDGTMPAVNTGSGTALASNSVTPSHSGDLAITGLTVYAATTLSSWTNGFALGNSGSINLTSAWAYQVYNSTSPLTAGVTIGTSSSYGMGIVLFKSAAICTDPGQSQDGTISVPNGVSGSYLSPSGTYVTPDCSTVAYWSPPSSACPSVINGRSAYTGSGPS